MKDEDIGTGHAWFLAGKATVNVEQRLLQTYQPHREQPHWSSATFPFGREAHTYDRELDARVRQLVPSANSKCVKQMARGERGNSMMVLGVKSQKIACLRLRALVMLAVLGGMVFTAV